jgi:hypothetical protein
MARVDSPDDARHRYDEATRQKRLPGDVAGEPVFG